MDELSATYFPSSNAGLAIGENSALKVNNPSLGRSGAGAATTAVATANTLRIVKEMTVNDRLKCVVV